MEIEDRAGLGYAALEKAAFAMMMQANPDCRHQFHFHTFNVRTRDSTQISIVKRRSRSAVPGGRIFLHTRHLLGSTYINDFNISAALGVVTAQLMHAFASRRRISSGCGRDRLTAAWCRSPR